MAFKKSFNEIFGTALVLSALLSTASAVDCHGKSFHCVNSTHFMICVDLGGGVSQSIDNFLIPCPAPTVCQGTNHFECEFPAPTTPVTTLNVISESTQPWEDIVVTTNSPQRKTTKEYSENYVNTESLSLADSFTTADYTTEMPLSSTPTDLNNINVTEAISTLPDSNYYETTTTVDTITEPILIHGTTTYSEQVVNTDNFTTGTTEVITEILQTIPENIPTGAVEVTTEIPIVDITTVEAFISNASDIPQTTPENITTGTAEVITEIPQTIPENIPTGTIEVTTEKPLVEITTVEAFKGNVSGILQTIPENITTATAEVITEIPQTIPENIPTGAIEVTTEIPLVNTTTGEDFIGNGSDILQTIAQNITTGTAEVITEIPQTIPENIPTGTIEVTTEKPLVEITTVEAFISNASDTPQTTPENITTGTAEVITEIPQTIPEKLPTGAVEVTTEIPIVDITTVEAFISNASDILQTIPENIITGTAEVITEIPQTIPENIPTGAIEVTTDKPLVETTTVEAFVSNTSDIPQTKPDNTTTGTAVVITEIPQTIPENIPPSTIEVTTDKPLVETTTVEAFVSNTSDIPQTKPDNTTTVTAKVIIEIPQTIPENIPTGVIEVTTEIPLVDTTTGEAFIGNASDILQTTPENITTGKAEVITEIPQTIPENIPTGAIKVTTDKPLVEITTVEAFVSNASDVPQTTPEITTTGTAEVITEIPQTIPEDIPPGAIEVITEIPVVDVTTGEAFIGNASDILQTIPENITTAKGGAITDIPLVDMSTADLNNVFLETTPSTISANDSSSKIQVNLTPVQENTTNVNITSNSTVNANDCAETTLNTDKIVDNEPVAETKTEESYTTEVNSLANSQFGSTGDIVRNGAALEQTTSDNFNFDVESANTYQTSTTGPKEILTTDTTVNSITELPALNEQNPINRLPTTIKAETVATENQTFSINQNDRTQTDDINITERPFIVTKNEQIQSISSDDKLHFTTETIPSINKTGIVTDTNNNNETVENIISSSQDKTRTETNEVIRNQEERKSTSDLPTVENKTDTNILANIIFDIVIQKPKTSTEKPMPTVTDENLNKVANEITTEILLLSASNDQIQKVTGDEALGTEKNTLITENNFVMDNTYLTIEKSTENTITQFLQEQEASTIETGYVATEQSNTNIFGNGMTTENSVYLSTDISILTTSEGFDDKIQSPNSTEKPVNILIPEIVKANSPNWGDIITTNNPLEQTENTLSSIFDINTIKHDLNKIPTKEKVFKGSGITDIPIIINLDSTTTGRDLIKNNLPLDNINGGLGSNNLDEREEIEININLKETTLTNEKETEIKSDITSGTTTEYNKIAPIDNIEIQENTRASLGTTDNKNVIDITSSVTLPHEINVKQIETTIDGNNAIDESSQDTKIGSSIPNMPVSDSKNISHTNINSDFSIDRLGTNTKSDAVDYATVAVVNFSSTVNSVTEKTNLSGGNLGVVVTKNDVINQQGNKTITENNDGRPSSSLNSGFERIDDNIKSQHSQTTLEPKEQETSIIHKNIEEDTKLNEVISESKADKITNKNQDSEQTINVGILTNGDETAATESNKGETSSSVNLGIDTIKNNIINSQSQIDTQSIDKVKSNERKGIEGTTDSNQIISDPQANTIIYQFNQDSKQTDVLNNNKTNMTETFSSVDSRFEIIENNQQNRPTSEPNDKGTSNVVPQTNTMINNLNQDLQQPNVAVILVNDDLNNDKTTKESNNGPTTIQTYPQSIDVATSKNYIISAPTNEHLPSTGHENIATQTTKTVNNLIDNQDLVTSTMLVTETNNETKSTVIENIQNALQAIGNFFNIASKNSTQAIGNTENQAQAEMNNNVSKEITEANIATESESVFNNLQVSKSNNILSKPDANIKWGLTESIPANNGQNIEHKNINSPVSHIVPFDETNENTKKSDDQVPVNEVSKIIIKEISSKTSDSMSKNQHGTVMESATLDTLTTKITKILSSDTANDNEGNLLSTYNSKVETIQIRTESYKPVTPNPATIITRIPSNTNNILHKSDNLLRVVPESQNVPYVNPTKPALSSTSEKTITDGDRADIGTVHSNAKLDDKNNVENAIALENIAQNLRSISTLIPGNSETQVDNALQSTDITITDSAFDGNTQKDLSSTIATPELISRSAQDTKPSTGEVNNSGTRNSAKVDVENIYEKRLLSDINQQGDLRDGNAHVSIVGKEINQRLIPNHETTSSGISANEKISPNNNITSTSTVQPRTNSVVKSTLWPENNNIISVISQNSTNGSIEHKSTNLEQNTSDNTPSLIKGQVIPREKPVNKPHSSVTSTTQSSMKNTLSKSVSTETENPKKQVVNNNTLHYSCINGVRGKYSDKDDCRKFYICFGNTEPIVGHCPVNTVFSDIKKLCTKNMSHCIRENEFKCPSDGRFSDVLQENVYYICVNHQNHLYRFKFQCQTGYTLNKTTVRCVENKEIESNESVSISSDDVSDSSGSTSITSTSSISTSSTSSSGGSTSSSSSSSNTGGDSESKSSKSKKNTEKSEDQDDDEDDDEVFECEKEGKFPVRGDCRRYYLCKKKGKGRYRRKLKKCRSGDIFHKSKKRCVDADDYEC